MDERVALHAHASQESCPYCHDRISAEQETWVCDHCETKLHAECFRENELRCTVLGCTGHAAVPAGARVEPLVLGPEEENARAERRARRQPCPRCHEKVSFSEETWACDACDNIHHAACFRANAFRCCVVGCRGRPRLPAGARADRRALRSITKEEKRVARRARHARAREAAGTPPVVRHALHPTTPAERHGPRPEPPETWGRGPLGLAALLGSAFFFAPLMLAIPIPAVKILGVAMTVAIWIVVLAQHNRARR